MKTKTVKNIFLCTLILVIVSGCKKDFLEKKASTQITNPTTLDDFESLLEYNFIPFTSGLNLLGSDEYSYKSYDLWLSAPTATERNSYIWEKDIFGGERAKDSWNAPYLTIFYANNVIKGISNVTVSDFNRNRWNEIKGWALFLRANAYHDLIRTFANTYDPNTSGTDPGVPLRLDPSIGVILPRASVKEVYDRIISDLNDAETLLPQNLPPTKRNHPSKVAANGLLSRVYLNMRDYEKAEESADRCLGQYSTLIDFNTLSKSADYPFTSNHAELIHLTIAENYSAYFDGLFNMATVVSKDLIDLYETEDLRLAIYFRKEADDSYSLKGNMSGLEYYPYPFVGLATDEIYLIKSECAARRNDITTAMSYLNKLLINRFPTSQFTPVNVSNSVDALNAVLLERRKELPFRGSRWDDLRRLNKEGRNIILTRELNGKIYTLAPDSKKYVYPIPDDEINLSGIQQNER